MPTSSRSASWSNGGWAHFRLRITLGLRREGGRWVIAHGHHSFPDLG